METAGELNNSCGLPFQRGLLSAAGDAQRPRAGEPQKGFCWVPVICRCAEPEENTGLHTGAEYSGTDMHVSSIVRVDRPCRK